MFKIIALSGVYGLFALLIIMFIREIRLMKKFNKKHNIYLNWLTIRNYVDVDNNPLIVEEIKILRKAKKKHMLIWLGSIVMYALIVAITGIVVF